MQKFSAQSILQLVHSLDVVQNELYVAVSMHWSCQSAKFLKEVSKASHRCAGSL
jgi:hypothetical protein